MKKMNLAEKIGFILIIIGFIFMLLNSQIENNQFSGIVDRYQLFYWGGLAIWAIGYMGKEAKKKKEKENNQTKSGS
tara:strand:- start:3769 stop:3996 length:228 start_codon:yes stop_codon:yes gene_type:complete